MVVSCRDGADVNAREPNMTDNSAGFRNQRFLITKVPTDNNDGSYYYVTNLFYGAQAGVYNGSSGPGTRIGPASD